MINKPQDHDDEAPSTDMPTDSPPTYESATGSMGGPRTSYGPSDGTKPAVPPLPSQPMSMHGATTASPGAGTSTRVYHYQNPLTGEHVASLLPPDHPQMICLQEGRHITQSKFGLLGVLAAVIWFPLGIGLCLLDRKVYCKRCGGTIEEGLCG